MGAETAPPRISVVVCTYNRARLLHGCLRSLAEQTLPKADYEVIVVDNGCIDETQSVVAEFVQRHPNFVGLIETQRGASKARNRGWAAARGEFVAFIDDDAQAYPDWLTEMASFTRRHPKVAVFGGPYERYEVAPVPDWFPTEYGTFGYGTDERPLVAHAEWLSGTNIVVRQDLLGRVQFSPDVGPRDGTFSYGEETKLVEELYSQGMIAFYVPSMKVRHLLAEYKMRLRYLLWSGYARGKSDFDAFGFERTLRSHALGVARQGVEGSVRWFTLPRMPWRRRLFYSCDGLCKEVGMLVAQAQRRWRKMSGTRSRK